MLSKESLDQIDKELRKYPVNQRRSAAMSALRIAQVEKGWLAPETIKFIAEYLGLAPMAVHEVATFYNMYNKSPVGKYKLSVCTNLPCALSGGAETGEHLKKSLGVGYGETTTDGLFTLIEGECMGACGYAPVMLLNNHTMCNRMTPEAVDRKLAELRQAGA
jgi:NADH-quinone oxidoreductase subunit E